MENLKVTSNENTYFLIDGGNNNKVVNEFNNEEEAMIFVNRKEHSESWENCYETFEDFKDNFFTISSNEMNEAIRTKGSRVKNYWT